MGNLNVVMINVASRDDGLRVLDRVAGGAKVEYEVLSEDAQTLLRETLKLDNP